MSTISPEVLEKLRKYDTPTVCNVIELFQIRPQNTGYMDGRIQACFPDLPPMVGFATTATFRSRELGSDQESYSSIDKQVAAFEEIEGPPVVVFQDLDDPCVGATFGEVLCTTFQAYGAQGIITSGAGRDLDQVKPLNFPAFSNGIICSHGYPQIPTINVPVNVGGVLIQPGDLLHGDLNGVTTIPKEIASEVADACDDFMKAEDAILNYVRSGDITPQGLTEACKECKSLQAALGERLRSSIN